MSTCVADNSNRKNILRRLFSIFLKKKEEVYEPSAAEVVTDEINRLWNMVREKNVGENQYSAFDCQKEIIESFRRVRERFSDEQLDDEYAWSRYVKVAVHCADEPIDYLIGYINETNFIPLTKRLTDLSNSILKGDDTEEIINAENFSAAVYHHILDNINATDIPSLLYLGRLAQKRGEYEEARKWFLKVTDTEDPFNGITAVLACYEEETKGIISSNVREHCSDVQCQDKIRSLNNSQYAIYEKWTKIMEAHISSSEFVPEQYKKGYVSLITGYARFERNRGNYKKAFKLLKKIPAGYPDMYRVYTEEAMIYQFRPRKNQYYSLERAIETFKKAYDAVEGESGRAVCAKSKKSILMPLANTYFQSGRYKEALDTCDSVLKIDCKEHRAITLKAKIINVA